VLAKKASSCHVLIVWVADVAVLCHSASCMAACLIAYKRELCGDTTISQTTFDAVTGFMTGDVTSHSPALRDHAVIFYSLPILLQLLLVCWMLHSRGELRLIIIIIALNCTQIFLSFCSCFFGTFCRLICIRLLIPSLLHLHQTHLSLIIQPHLFFKS